MVVQCDGETLELGLAGGQVLDGRVGHRVGPAQLPAAAAAGGVAVLDRCQRAQRGAHRGAAGRDQVHVRQVDIGKADHAAVGQVAGRAQLLGHRADQVLGRDHRRVVGAGDGPGHRRWCGRGAIRNSVAHAHGGGLAGRKVLEGAVRRIEREAVAGRVVGDAGRQAGRWRHIDHRQHCAAVHVRGIGQSIKRAGCAIFSSGAGHGPAHQRRVVGARDLQGYCCPAKRPITQPDCIGKGIGQKLTRSEILQLCAKRRA